MNTTDKCSFDYVCNTISVSLQCKSVSISITIIRKMQALARRVFPYANVFLRLYQFFTLCKGALCNFSFIARSCSSGLYVNQNITGLGTPLFPLIVIYWSRRRSTNSESNWSPLGSGWTLGPLWKCQTKVDPLLSSWSINAVCFLCCSLSILAFEICTTDHH